ncbi:hypothetical protein BDV96DRAFT_151931 [Lophiotrema nucula]|uniref:Uncharacterized protein n=1 Tax=Lophiotrema nucula TaxID=690887 RepID=A0A6A5Z2F9_9PLEO|nr:hypothetical protein BDV96DRAFT_151931 [Lophiotrema nucula]
MANCMVIYLPILPKQLFAILCASAKIHAKMVKSGANMQICQPYQMAVQYIGSAFRVRVSTLLAIFLIQTCLFVQSFLPFSVSKARSWGFPGTCNFSCSFNLPDSEFDPDTARKVFLIAKLFSRTNQPRILLYSFCHYDNSWQKARLWSICAVFPSLSIC